MKTLILNGSPRENGDTAYLLRIVKENISGEYTVLNAYDGYKACTDCRLCSTVGRCSFNDELTSVLMNINEYERVIVATPLYYNQPTGALLALMSRFQLIFAAENFAHSFKTNERLGGIIVVGGGDTVINSEDAKKTIRIALRSINCRVSAYCESLRTSTLPAAEDTKAHRQVLDMLNTLGLISRPE
jgi:multimeric flavodoxin WrbA